MFATILIAGFTLGFAGSLHCIAMCGPLSLALPTAHLSPSLKVWYLFIYQLGRVLTYSILGFIFSVAGRGIFIAGFQQWFSITMGMLMLLMAVIYFIQKTSIHFSLLNGLYARLSILMGRIIKSNLGIISFALLGMANGLLPCGMVYIALATVLSMHSLANGVGFMAMFGAGTLPMMLLLILGSHSISPVLRRLFSKAIPVFISLAGIFLIMRGLGFGLFIQKSFLTFSSGQPINCHP